jgi:hypothetical protein
VVIGGEKAQPGEVVVVVGGTEVAVITGVVIVVGVRGRWAGGGSSSLGVRERGVRWWWLGVRERVVAVVVWW